MGRFRERPGVVIDPWALFAFLAGAVVLLLAIAWLRSMIGALGPD